LVSSFLLKIKWLLVLNFKMKRKAASVSVPRRPRTASTYLPSLKSAAKRRRATFRAANLPPNALKSILARLSPRNVASAQLAFPKSTLRVSKPVQRGSKLKKIMRNNGLSTDLSPKYVQVVKGLSKYYPNSEPLNNYGTNVGYHKRRVNTSRAMLNSLVLGNNGYYHTPGGNKYSFRKGTLYTVVPAGRASRAVMTGLKRNAGLGLRLKH
jgi:hypothetical protein